MHIHLLDWNCGELHRQEEYHHLVELKFVLPQASPGKRKRYGGKHLIDTRLVDYDIPESMVWVMLLPREYHIVVKSHRQVIPTGLRWRISYSNEQV